MESIHTTGAVKVSTPDSLVPTSYMDMIANAVTSGASIEALERLMNMKREYDKDVAKNAFTAALAKFQEECPEIRKNKKVEFDTKMGKTSYNYAPLEDIHRQVKHLLVKYGFTRTWKHSYPGNGKTRVTCILSHIGGHSTETDMDVDADMSGSKNAIQGQRSAITFARRTTLEGALGITTADQDIDGRLPELDVDKLHQQYMELYNKVPQTDPQKSAMDPDNWAVDRTAKVYVAAIGAARKKLTEISK
jgi:hypothetical protein